MRSHYWSFVEACDATHSTRAVKDLLIATYREMGVEGFAIVTHFPVGDLRSLGVMVHNWPAKAVDFLYAKNPSGFANPLFTAVEATRSPVHWPQLDARRDAMKRTQRDWFERLRKLVSHSEGVSQELRSVIVNASCSVTSNSRLDPDRVRVCMRIGNYAYQYVLALQKPRPTGLETLTPREYEFLSRATLLGEKPAMTAESCGVKVTTVRTARQSANKRLDARTPEEAVWRMIETGQLFRSGRTRRPRGR